jgi:hypothetical protein
MAFQTLVPPQVHESHTLLSRKRDSHLPEKARRQVNPDSYCTNFSCTPPAVPVFYQVFNNCGCKTIPPQCTNLTCDALYHQSYDNTTGKCICEFGTGIFPFPTSVPPYLVGKISAANLPRDNSVHATCPDIFCGAGNVLDSSTCACEPVWPPDACPVMKCTAGHHAVYNSTAGGCGCDLDCPTLSCTAGYTSFYNSTTRACTCQKVSAASVILRARWITSSTVNQLPTPLSPSGTACRDLYCISEMTPQVDSVSGQCKCVWIPGFGPSGT